MDICLQIRSVRALEAKQRRNWIHIYLVFGIILEQEANKIPLHLISILLLQIWLIKSFFSPN